MNKWQYDDERIFAELHADGVARKVRVEYLNAIVSVRAHYRALADTINALERRLTATVAAGKIHNANCRDQCGCDYKQHNYSVEQAAKEES